MVVLLVAAGAVLVTAAGCWCALVQGSQAWQPRQRGAGLAAAGFAATGFTAGLATGLAAAGLAAGFATLAAAGLLQVWQVPWQLV